MSFIGIPASPKQIAQWHLKERRATLTQQEQEDERQEEDDRDAGHADKPLDEVFGKGDVFHRQCSILTVASGDLTNLFRRGIIIYGSGIVSPGDPGRS